MTMMRLMRHGVLDPPDRRGAEDGKSDDVRVLVAEKEGGGFDECFWL